MVCETLRLYLCGFKLTMAEFCLGGVHLEMEEFIRMIYIAI